MTQRISRLGLMVVLTGIVLTGTVRITFSGQKGESSTAAPSLMATPPAASVAVVNRATAASKKNSSHKRRQSPQVEATEALLTELNLDRYLANITALANFKSRYTASPGCEEAAKFLLAYFRERGLKVRLQPFQNGNLKGNNVVATLPGTDDPEGKRDFIVLGAHYDSVARDGNPVTTAPGAEDNASGVAAMMELADLFHQHPPRTTLVFVAFAGEEEGLFGSRAFVDEIVANGSASRMRAALVMDMIGFTEDDDLDILFETDAAHEQLANASITLAKQYTKLRPEKSLNPFGSDHVSFLDAKLPAFLVIENDWDAYPAYHKVSDTPSMISPAMARESLRVVTAWTYEMANLAEAAPVITKVSLNGTSLVLSGDGFRNGATIEIGTDLLSRTKTAKPTGRGDGAFQQIKVKDTRLPSLIPAGQTVTLRVANPSGMKSTPFTFKRE
ncbi:MAG: Zn-dependent exopeptidase M28 [Blastocatellia bacterium]|nr:Zn-dependent exopeptidase M28 [Blastocatellia bacterium]